MDKESGQEIGILIIDDDELTRRLIQRLLEREFKVKVDITTC